MRSEGYSIRVSVCLCVDAYSRTTGCKAAYKLYKRVQIYAMWAPGMADTAPTVCTSGLSLYSRNREYNSPKSDAAFYINITTIIMWCVNCCKKEEKLARSKEKSVEFLEKINFIKAYSQESETKITLWMARDHMRGKYLQIDDTSLFKPTTLFLEQLKHHK